MVDLHTHVIPGVDDGAPTLQTALEMLRCAAVDGTETIAATPHIDFRWHIETSAVGPAVEDLRTAAKRCGIPVGLVSGGEVSLTRALEMTQEDLERVLLGRGRWLLLEAPHELFTPGVMFSQAVSELRHAQVNVLLAHPERCPTFHRDPALLARLVAQGTLCSVTASSLTGGFGGTVRRFAVKMLTEGLVHNIASDAHDATSRPPLLRSVEDALRQIGARPDDLVDYYCGAVPEAILAGDVLPAPRRPALSGLASSRSPLKRLRLARGRKRSWND